ncbi:Ig-like domain-containing protein, partial [Yersinia ruckeri]
TKFESNKRDAIADGKDPVTFTATVVDRKGGPAPKVLVKFIVTKGSGTLSKAEVTTDEYGVAKVMLTSVVGGWIDVTAKVASDTETTGKKASTDFFVDINPHDKRSLFYFDPVEILANGKTTSTLWVQIYGTDGSQIKYAENHLAISVQDMQEQGVAAKTTYSPVEMAQTTYYWSKSLFSGKKAGKIKVSLIYMGKETALNTELTFKADVTTAKIATLTADKNVALDNGKDAITFTATVKDAGGNPAPNVEVKFTPTKDGKLSAPTATTDEHGVAKVTLTSQVAGKVGVSAKTAVDTEGKTTSVIFKVDVTTARIDLFRTNKTVAVGNGNDGITFTAVVKDAGGNPAPNVEVKFTPTKDGKLSAPTAITDEYGVAQVSLTSQVAGRVGVNAKTAVDTGGKTITVTFTEAQYKLGGLSATQVVSQHVSTITVSAVVTTDHGQPVKGVKVLMTAPMDSSCFSDSKGRVSFQLTESREVSRVVVLNLAKDSKSMPVNFIRNFYLDLKTHPNYDGGFKADGHRLFEARGRGTKTVYISAEVSVINGYKWDGALIRPGIEDFDVTDKMRTVGGYCHLEGDYITPSMVCEVKR